MFNPTLIEQFVAVTLVLCLSAAAVLQMAYYWILYKQPARFRRQQDMLHRRPRHLSRRGFARTEIILGLSALSILVPVNVRYQASGRCVTHVVDKVGICGRSGRCTVLTKSGAILYQVPGPVAGFKIEVCR